MLTSFNSKDVEESTKAAQASEKKISKATEQVQQLHNEVYEFMVDFTTFYDKSIANMNNVIEGFRSSLKVEKEALSTLRADIKLDNADLNIPITQQLTKLQSVLATENKIMDALAEQMQKTKVLTEKMKNTTFNVAKLEEEKSLVKGCTSEINNNLC